jgi:hypothetical protein
MHVVKRVVDKHINVIDTRKNSVIWRREEISNDYKKCSAQNYSVRKIFCLAIDGPLRCHGF